jgi:hypothetical protein
VTTPRHGQRSEAIHLFHAEMPGVGKASKKAALF